MLEKNLQKIGLTEKEAKVYLASLELGKSSVQKIATKAKVNRATTYVILEQLMAKGAIDSVEEGKKRHFVATGPYALKQIIRHQADEISKKKKKLEKLFPKLKKVHNVLPNRAVVRYYEGKDALLAVREQFLQSKSKEIYAFHSETELLNVFSREERRKYSERRQKAGISHNVIYNPSKEGSFEDTERLNTVALPVPKDKFHFPCDIRIVDDFVSISILSGQPSGILIESQSIAETFRSIFKLAKEAAEKYQKGGKK